MSQEQEELIIAMIALAKEERALNTELLNQIRALQKNAEKTESLAREVVANVPAEIRKGVVAGAHEILREATGAALEGLNVSVAGLKEAVAEGRVSAKAIRIRLAGSSASGYSGGYRWTFLFCGHAGAHPGLDLELIKAQVGAEQVTLDELRSDTWRLELVNYGGVSFCLLGRFDCVRDCRK